MFAFFRVLSNFPSRNCLELFYLFLTCPILWHLFNSMRSGRQKRFKKLNDNVPLTDLQLDCNHDDSNYRASNRPFELPTVPTLRPSDTEFSDFYSFLQKNQQVFSECPAAKVVPAAGWNLPIALDLETFKFKGQKQKLHTDSFRYDQNYDYFNKLKEFHEERGLYFNKPPMLQNQPLDFLQLRNTVSHFTSLESTLSNSLLSKITETLNLPDSKDVRQILARTYERYIKPYERTQSHTSSANPSLVSRSTRISRSSVAHTSTDAPPMSEHDTSRSNGSQTVGKRTFLERGEQCEFCASDSNPETILLCDGCECAYHISCLDPPLNAVPKEDWYCDTCKHGIHSYDPRKGQHWTVATFRDHSNKYMEALLSKKAMPVDPTENDLENLYWSMMDEYSLLSEQHQVERFTTSSISSLPSKELQPSNQSSFDGWNLRNIPHHKSSPFNFTISDMHSLANPQMSIGMAYSTYEWQQSPIGTSQVYHNRYGSTVTWYILPPDQTEKFEKFVHDLDNSYEDSFFLDPSFQLPFPMSPALLLSNGIQVMAVDLRPNEFLVVSPKSYHFGFHLGFGCLETAHFATIEWIKDDILKSSLGRMKDLHIYSPISYDAIIISMALSRLPEFTNDWFIEKLQGVISFEVQQRELLSKSQPKVTIRQLQDHPIPQVVCSKCQSMTFTSYVKTHVSSEIYCLEHYMRDSEISSQPSTVYYRWGTSELSRLLDRFSAFVRAPVEWSEKLKTILLATPKPHIKSLEALLADAEYAMLNTKDTSALRSFIRKANAWINSINHYLSISPIKKRKEKKLSFMKIHDQRVNSTGMRDLENLFQVLQKSKDMAFTCEEIEAMKKKVSDLLQFRVRLTEVFSGSLDRRMCQNLLNEAESLGFMFPELTIIQKYLTQYDWLDMFYAIETEKTSDADLEKLISFGLAAGVPEDNDHMIFVRAMKGRAEIWENQVRDVLSKSNVSYDRLSLLKDEALTLCVDKVLYTRVVEILQNAEEVKSKISTLCERSQDKAFKLRPAMDEVKDALAQAEKLPMLSDSIVALQKMYDSVLEWIRRGKRLFGKANAPLEILGQHLEYVEKRNAASLSLLDRPGPPMEPSSREASPDSEGKLVYKVKRPRIFCFCRLPENGVMIECEICHEWYHAKCLKMSKKKLRQDEKFTCPVCDYRVEIPRLSNRPRLEDLQSLLRDVVLLPFKPKETDILENVVDLGTRFRQELQAFAHNPFSLTMAEVLLARFYLRKMEGAEILLADETNLFRQKLHECVPIAPTPPPVIGESKSTRKPRPTKRQRQIMKQVAEGVLPESAIAPSSAQNDKKAPMNNNGTAMNKTDSPQSDTKISHENGQSSTALLKQFRLTPTAELNGTSNLCAYCQKPANDGSFTMCSRCNKDYHYGCMGEMPNNSGYKTFTCQDCKHNSEETPMFHSKLRNGIHAKDTDVMEKDDNIGRSSLPNSPSATVSKYSRVMKTPGGMQDMLISRKLSCGEHVFFGTDVFTSLGDMVTETPDVTLDEFVEKNDGLTESYLNM
ncbi:histone demethylase (H3-trimethyl-K4 specific), Lid2 complex subunit Lid2 [Schizosaccharomyces osmophilus]|uniref:Histone demethylase (H3-trimethyl-K4 specific), Lid2 complex subunit Lid2 n=1 Tax=Schizosaccharomyces osmophilus TaxID=2545709 RepID=A0AAF0AU94_9SCHI|nr:histone demethylase (H3-trimethyl-K4 specific), Lid2 complex subunit Lid2 [Schizosaccharomyces osmophilus]WBW71133.1 histone demethylase (H3-trimethyl-K4 specific), Lid2 complex subunit Lid2 [Schizosaccharomyces osmophilus]